MSKILLFSFSPVHDCNKWQLLSYYESISKAFLERGHQVLNIITNDYIVDPWNGNNISISKYIEEYITNQIKRFNPDLIISYNNSKIKNIENNVNCPIVIAEADRWMYFSDKYRLKKNVSRYHFFYFTCSGEKDLIANFGANKNQIFFIPNATSFKNKKLKKINDINFIGTLYDINSAKNKVEFNNAKYRFNILNKLKVFKPIIYSNNVPSIYEPLKSFISDEKKYEKIQLEQIFNQSFISLNISNLQSKNIGFSWRLLDIMASNTLLITEKNKFLEKNKLLKISTKQLYYSSNDCHDKIKYFLKNKSLMNDLILQQNENIKNYGRWIDRIKQIEEIFNLKVNKAAYPQKIKNNFQIKILKTKIKKLDFSILFTLYIVRFIKYIVRFIKYIFRFTKNLFISKMRNNSTKDNFVISFLKKYYFASRYFFLFIIF